MIEVALGLLVLAGMGFLVRLIRGPSLPDRIVALDGLLLVVVAAVLVDDARTGTTVTLPVVLVVALVGFVGTSVAARFVERQGG